MPAELIGQEYLQLLRQARLPSDQVFLVGGAVRDWVLDSNSKDYDLVVSGSAFSVARKFANLTRGDFYVMDDVHQVARVLLGSAECRTTFDFSGMRGGTLEDDLKDRDFSMNAMAIALDRLQEIIDPLKGRSDLEQRRLVPCSSHSFDNDPIRLLRAVRFSAQFGLKIDSRLKKTIAKKARLLGTSSRERIRDELFQLLSLQDAFRGVQVLSDLDLFQCVVPEIALLGGVQQSHPHTMDVWNHTLFSLQWLERILDHLQSDRTHGHSPLETLLAPIRQFFPQVRRVLADPIQEERNRTSLLKLAALLHDVAKPETQTRGDDGRYHFYGHHINGSREIDQIGKNLALSNSEIEYISVLVRQHMAIHWLCKEGNQPSKKAVFRFFAPLGEYGIDLCFLSLSDMLAKSETAILSEKVACERDVVRTLLDAWFNHRAEVIDPPLLLDGNDIMQLLGLSSSPVIGELIAALREAQASGEITDKGEARKMVQDLHSSLTGEKE